MRKKQWQRQERDLEREGAGRTPASGGGVRKGDNLGQNFCVQCKSTANRSIKLAAADLEKMVLDARIESRIPVMQLEIGEDGERYAVLRWSDFTSILDDANLDL